ncbi:MAG: DUF4136 domain-containing protein [Emcibacter sp.]|nr:DUF4136 domain-containing protein [Emcibacter sp.]
MMIQWLKTDLWQKTRVTFLVLLALSVTGCARSIVSDVTRFHNLTAPNAETIEVVSMDPHLQNSLEFGQYAELVGRHLGTAGYQPPQDTPSLLIAKIAYAVHAADSITDSGPRSSVGIGVGSGGHHSSVGIGLSFPIGNSEPQQNYVRMLSLEIFRRSDGVKLYEGQATNSGPEGLPQAMPYLVDALFQNFPGQSGTSSRIKATP